MKKTILTYLFSILLICLGGIFLWACESWELPTRKSQRNCTKPQGTLIAQMQQRKVDFSITGSSGTIDRVLWDFGNGSTTATTGMTVSYTYPTSGTYTAKATLTNSCLVETTLQSVIVVSDAVSPTVSLQAATNIVTSSALVGMTVISTGNASITQYGVCYSDKNTMPTKETDATQSLIGSLAVNTSVPFSLTGLQPNTLYYVRSFATNSAGKTGYSDPQTFRTGVGPSVSSNGNPTVGVSTAVVSFILTNPGNPAAIQYGVLYSSTSSTPDINNSGPGVTVTNPNLGANTLVNLTDLKANTTYYYRPYAKLPSGEIVYGPINSFTTQVDAVADGLIAYLPFTDKSLQDATGNGNNALLIDNPGFTSDRKGKANAAILLDGINDYFYMADNSSLQPDAFSISIWIKPNAINNVNDRMQIYNKSRWSDSKFEMYSSLVKINETGPGLTFMTNIKQNSNCEVAKGWQSFEFSSNPQLGNWYHLVFTYSGRSSRMYFNGVLLDQKDNLPAASIDKCPGGELKFGAQIQTFPNYFSGAMDEVRIYRRVLSANEVQTLFTQ
ncbi:LamG-like jellyroll fold domain-containing protein [Spirosoma endbachense]|uniref:PKD domain-containing protein n=1 Tax=Spirosoma endbachense TaxID=2666025 RepID=A0A6P1VLT3_9BACT|nr:LamG-like jellyroll fold domain-containing protein [Spirosoma endbachense]QHV94023.1 PKD domain-containing protein [Spirosoma endbachense]